MFNETALYLAVDYGNKEVVKILLEKENIDVNIPCILNKYLFMKF